MKREKITLIEERNIITNMIMNDKFLRELRPIISLKFFDSSYIRVVANWILEYFDKYKKAPKKEIESIYRLKYKTVKDEDDSEIISKFLVKLSKDHEKKENTDFSVEQAIRYLQLQSLRKLNETLEITIEGDDPEKALSILSNYKRIETLNFDRASLFQDHTSIYKAFMDDDETLFKFPKALGAVCGDFLRNDLVAFLAASNRGKTWWQYYCGQVAAFNGLSVVFFSLEMPLNQMTRRAWQSLTGSPRKDCKINIPKFVKEEDSDRYIIENETKFKKKVNLKDVPKKQQQFRTLARGGRIEIIALPANTATIDDLENRLDNLFYYENFTPDVIIVDSADLIKSKQSKENRFQLDDIWKSLRGMAQRRKALVVTATQADRKSQVKDAKSVNISEHIGKLYHVSKMIVLNQTPEEYENNIMRVSSLKERDGKRTFMEAIVLNCLDIGRPHLDSKFKGEIDYEF